MAFIESIPISSVQYSGLIEEIDNKNLMDLIKYDVLVNYPSFENADTMLADLYMTDKAFKNEVNTFTQSVKSQFLNRFNSPGVDELYRAINESFSGVETVFSSPPEKRMKALFPLITALHPLEAKAIIESSVWSTFVSERFFAEDNEITFWETMKVKADE